MSWPRNDRKAFIIDANQFSHDAAPEIAQIPNMAESKKILVLSHIFIG